jgi:hypothetical protein
MKYKNSQAIKVDSDFKIKLDDIMKTRVKNDLANLRRNEISYPEATRLILKCPSWYNVEKELKTLPKKAKDGRII